MNDYATIETLIGTIGVHTNSKGVYRLHLANDLNYTEAETPYNNQSPILKNALKQLREYFY